jgi:DNA-directed RNA polymerase I subunit RPA2
MYIKLLLLAMMIEVMAGKSAVLHGLVHDATPFRFSEKDTAIDYFGRMLEAGKLFTCTRLLWS